jgi:hypothetical protein
MTTDEFGNRLIMARQALEQLPGQAAQVNAQEILGRLLRRIFNQGRAADGTKIGKYDDTKKQKFLSDKARPSLNKRQQKKLDAAEDGVTYKELRELRGLQTEYVDLQFTGELFESLQIGVRSGKLVFGFTNPQRSKVAGYLEDKYGKRIFIMSAKERQEAIDIMRAYIITQFNKIITDGVFVA